MPNRSREREHLYDLRMGGRGGVVDSHAHGHGAALQAHLNLPLYLCELLRSCFAVGGVSPGKETSWLAHDLHADRNMADADAKIDERLPFSLGVPFVYIIGANLELQ